jgi:hypothetical protein
MKNLPLITHQITLIILFSFLLSPNLLADCRNKYVKATYAYEHNKEEHSTCKVDQCTKLKKGILPYSKNILVFSGSSIAFYQLWATSIFSPIAVFFIPVFSLTGVGIAYQTYEEDQEYLKMINLIDEANLLIEKNKNSPLMHELMRKLDMEDKNYQKIALRILQMNKNKTLCKPKLLKFDELTKNKELLKN